MHIMGYTPPMRSFLPFIATFLSLSVVLSLKAWPVPRIPGMNYQTFQKLSQTPMGRQFISSIIKVPNPSIQVSPQLKEQYTQFLEGANHLDPTQIELVMEGVSIAKSNEIWDQLDVLENLVHQLKNPSDHRSLSAKEILQRGVKSGDSAGTPVRQVLGLTPFDEAYFQVMEVRTNPTDNKAPTDHFLDEHTDFFPEDSSTQ